MSKTFPDNETLRILVLDGGDINCLSQLFILQEYINRLEMDSGDSILPAEHFHHIAGVAGGGIIAALLGIFSHSAEVAAQKYIDICQATFPLSDVNKMERQKKIREALMSLIIEGGFDEDTKVGEAKSRCRVSLGYLKAINLSTWNAFRNFPSSLGGNDDRLIDALCACWASPPSGEMTIKTPLGNEAVLSAITTFSNPTLQVLKDAQAAFGPDQPISLLMNVGAGTPVRGSEAKSPSSITARQAQMTAEELQRKYSSLNVYYRLCVDSNFDSIASADENAFSVIAAHTAGYLASYLGESTLDACQKASARQSLVTLRNMNEASPISRPSANGLPPLSPYYINRQEPMAKINDALLGDEYGRSLRLMVITGIGGSGKTQMAIYFAKTNQDRFQHIFFIDASSAESIFNGLLKRMRSIDSSFEGSSLDDILQALAEPNEVLTTRWLLIFDNVDDPNLDISEFIPLCDHGSVLITSRNAQLAALDPENHLPVDVMTPGEAVEALLSSAAIDLTRLAQTSVSSSADMSAQKRHFLPNSDKARSILQGKGYTDPTGPPSEVTSGVPDMGIAAVSQDSAVAVVERHRRLAYEIVKELEYLPVAVIQAGCYIRKQQSLETYLPRLQANRDSLLRYHTIQRDRLKYKHGVYAAFDTTLKVLSDRAIRLLSILSFFHYAGFPRSVFTIAATKNFAHESFLLFDRGAEHGETINLLKSIFCPNGDWDEVELDKLLDELQQYSLVTLIPFYSTVTLRFHPLLHAWAHDRQTSKEKLVYRAAAVRLLVCATDYDDGDIWEQILPHFDRIFPVFHQLHINDQAAFLRVLENNGREEETLPIMREIYDKVEGRYGKEHVRTTNAMMGLAAAYEAAGDEETMEKLERQVLDLRRALCEPESEEILEISINLSRTLKDLPEVPPECEELLRFVTDTRLKVSGELHPETAEAMNVYGQFLMRAERYDECAPMFERVVSIRTQLFGRTHWRTTQALEALVECYREQHDPRWESLQREIVSSRESIFGKLHPNTLHALNSQADAYYKQERFAEAEDLWKQEIAGRKASGETDLFLLGALDRLCQCLLDQKKDEEYEAGRREEIAGRREVQGNQNSDTLVTIESLANFLYEKKRYDEAEAMYLEVLEGYKIIYGAGHVHVLTAMGNLARCRMGQERFADAEPLCIEELESRKALSTEVTTDLLLAIFDLARCKFELDNIKAAQELWESELEGRKKIHGDLHADTLDSIYWIGRCLFKLNRYEEAEKNFRAVLAGRKELFGMLYEDTTIALYWVAKCRSELKFHKEAEDMWTEELILERQIFPTINDSIVVTMEAIAQSLMFQERYQEASSHWDEVLKARKALHPGLSKEVLNAMFRKARSLFGLEKYDEALELWKQELEERRRLKPTLDSDALDAMHWLRKCHLELGNIHEAEALVQEELPKRRELHGNTHADTISAMSGLSECLCKVDRRSEAEPLLREALEQTRLLRGGDHEDVFERMQDLSKYLFDSERHAEAEQIGREIVSLAERLFGTEDERTLLAAGDVGLYLYSQGKHREEESFRRQAVRGLEKIRNNGHEELFLNSLFNLAMCLFLQDRYIGAERLWIREVQGRRNLHGDLHVDTLDALHWFARCRFERDRFRDATFLFKLERLGRKRLNGDDHIDSIECLDWLALSHFNLDEYAYAQRLWKKVLASRRRLSDDVNEDVLDALSWQARCFAEMEEYERAELIYRWNVAAWKRIGKEQSEDAIFDLQWLGQCLFKQGQYREAEIVWRRELLAWKHLEGHQSENVASTYDRLADCLEERKEIKESLEFRRKAIAMWRLIGNRAGVRKARQSLRETLSR